MLWVLKRMVSMRGFLFEHPKCMFKLMDKKIITILSKKISLTGPMMMAMFSFCRLCKNIFCGDLLEVSH